MPDHGGHLKGCSRYLKPYTLNFKPERCLSQKMFFFLLYHQRFPKMYHKKRDKQKSQLQIARSARRKYQCKNLRSSGPEDDRGDQTRKQTRGSCDSSQVQLTGHLPLLGSSCGYGGSTKNGSFYYPFPCAKSVYCKGNLRTFRKFQEYVFFWLFLSPFWSCAHISLRHFVSHGWVQTSMLHCEKLRLDKHTCCRISTYSSHPQKKTSLQVLFETFRQILDESARIRSNSYPSVVSQNGVVSVYGHVDLQPSNGKCSSYSHVWSLIGVSGDDKSFLETRTSPVRVAVQTKKHVFRSAFDVAKTVL